MEESGQGEKRKFWKGAQIPQNHRITQAGKDYKDHQAQLLGEHQNSDDGRKSLNAVFLEEAKQYLSVDFMPCWGRVNDKLQEAPVC